MAVYKVIQDIESEDKLLGPLTLKGLVYAMIVGACLFIDFRLILSGALGPLKWIFVLLSLPPITLFGVLASPLGREQPTEVWLLSRIRFMIQSRTRIWNQSGITNLVTVTAPKKIEAMLTKNLNQTEVKSRLEALATTLDSRGWAVKNVNVSMGGFAGYFDDTSESTERLVDTSSVIREVPVVDVHASDDILDENNNQTAQKFQNMMVEAETQRRAALQEKLEAARAQAAEAEAPEEHTHTEEIHDVKPLNSMPEGGFRKQTVKPAAGEVHARTSSVTEKSSAGKLELANAGNDLSVASIAKLAGRDESSNGEVAIALH
jgi:hypothetical protein